MTDYELILSDRITKIQKVISEYGEENFCMSFSGGKDSTAVSALLDIALPNNRIPRVYADTGVELNMIRDFVFEKAKNDSRIIVIKPTVPIKPMLERDGYPFKSKNHAVYVNRFQSSGRTKSVMQYLGEREDKEPWSPFASCPKILRYQFNDDFTLKISDKCCKRLKEEPLERWKKENGIKYGITGIMRSEGGRRANASCLSFRPDGKLIHFQPFAYVSSEWEEWLIKSHNIEICGIYKEPYNFPRTGCKGCPFAINLQQELDTLEKFFPSERKQCEAIWKPVYDEYRRIGYRLKKKE